jgi:hypothetical protein
MLGYSQELQVADCWLKRVLHAKNHQLLASCNALAGSGFATNASKSTRRRLGEARALLLGNLDQVWHMKKSQLVVRALREIWTRERDRGGCRSVARPYRCRLAALRQVHPQRTLRPLDSRPVQAADCTNYGQRRDGPEPAAPARPHLRRAPAPQRPEKSRRPRAAAGGAREAARSPGVAAHGEQRVAGLRPDGLRGAPGRGHRRRQKGRSRATEIFRTLRRRRWAARASAAARLFSDDARDAVLSLVDTAVITISAAVGARRNPASGLLLLAAAPR